MAKEWKPITSPKLREIYSTKIEWAIKIIPKLKEKQKRWKKIERLAFLNYVSKQPKILESRGSFISQSVQNLENSKTLVGRLSQETPCCLEK